MSNWSTQELAERIGAHRREMAGRIRKMTISITDESSWQMLGHLAIDPTDRENREIEPFTGIGIYARPPAGSDSAEAIVVQVGGSNCPAIVATRDEATRAAVAGGVQPNETAIFNTLAMLLVKANGTIEVGSGPLAQPTMMGTTFLNALLTLTAAISTYANAAGTEVPALAAAGTALAAAVTAFNAAASDYLTTIAKVT